jgi:hypothetical protein
MSAQYFQGSRSYCSICAGLRPTIVMMKYISEEWLESYVIRVASEETGRHLSFGVLTVKNHYARTVQRITKS